MNKKKYKKAILNVISTRSVVCVAKSGMGMCKTTFFEE